MGRPAATDERLLDRCAEIHDTLGDFADALIFYTPSLSCPLAPKGALPLFEG